MSLCALVSGRLAADPEQRTGRNGNPYTRATVSVHDGDAWEVVGVMAFGAVADQLASLAKGDAVAVSGRAKVNTWTTADGQTRAGLGVTADAVLSVYSVRKRRSAQQAEDLPPLGRYG